MSTGVTNPSDGTEITKPVFYLDWNVISYMNDPKLLALPQRVTFLCLSAILNNIDPSSCFLPYSYAHLSDIRQGPAESHALWLSYLEKVSAGWEVVEAGPDRTRVALVKRPSIHAHFSDYASQQAASEGQHPLYDHMMDVAFEPARKELLREIDSGEAGTNTELLTQAVELFSQSSATFSLHAVRFSKTLRHQMQRQSRAPFKYPEAKHAVRVQDRSQFREMIDKAIAKSSLPYNGLTDLEDGIPFVGTAGFLSSFMERVNRLATIANILGIGIDRLRGDTAFRSLVNDLGHLALGLRCHYFVSEDKALQEKALFVKNTMGLRVTVLSAEGLNRLLLSQIAAHHRSTLSQQSSSVDTDVTFSFADQDGREIRRYVVHPDDRVDGMPGT